MFPAGQVRLQINDSSGANLSIRFPDTITLSWLSTTTPSVSVVLVSPKCLGLRWLAGPGVPLGNT